MVNVSKLQAVLDYITIQHPEGWEQGVWAKRVKPEHVARLSPVQRTMLTMDPNVCGSTACLAGSAVALEFGRFMAWNRMDDNSEDAACVGYAPNIPQMLRGASISEAARMILDLTHEQSERLFDGDNSLWTLWDLADEFTDYRIVRPDNEIIQDAIDRMIAGRHARDQLIDLIDEMDRSGALA